MQRTPPLLAVLLSVVAVAIGAAAVGVTTAAARETDPGVAVAPETDPGVATTAARETDPVVLIGAQLGSWAAPADHSARLPLVDLLCAKPGEPPEDPTSGGAGDVGGMVDMSGCPHNQYSRPDASTGVLTPAGTPVGRLLGYRWSARKRRFRQIPFQVDEVFARYLNNAKSGFSPYSGEDRHATYAYDREGFRWRAEAPGRPCAARPDSEVARDPVRGLDHDDELAFMAADAGPRAPSGARLPRRATGVREIRIDDPTDPSARPRYAYVVRASHRGPDRRYTARNGYVRYRRDADANVYAYSQSSYGSYGNAPKGVYCDDHGQIVRGEDGRPKIGQRRPRDTATVETDRYRFRYDGRWLMTRIQIARRDGRRYGPDLVDRWKARAFAQDPGSETPCCGYEEEENNWGGSSVLLGERVGPVRAIRETWGADSGTHVIRRETFYRRTMRQKTWLRVHPVPPLDGLYAQWDLNAGRVTRFYSARKPEGVPVDGVNDEVFGNLDDPCNRGYDANTTGPIDQGYRKLYRSLELCRFPYHQSVDTSDPTFGEANAALSWSQVSGPHGTIVDRLRTTPGEMPAAGAAQAVAAVPYYRDDACFDDGTGDNPGPHMAKRSADEPATLPDGTARECWTSEKAPVPGDRPRFFQGSIATHGVHLLFVVESDNARLTAPATEIVQDWDMVMLPGNPGNVGERYGRTLEKPLVATAAGRPDLRPAG